MTGLTTNKGEIMTEKEKAAAGCLYDANYDEDLIAERTKCKDLCFKYNNVKPSDTAKQRKILKELINDPNGTAAVTAPFWCDYGYNITVGKNFYSNHNLVILDGAKVSMGDNVFIAPNCCITTAGHPIDAKQRADGLEIALPVTIGNDVWIGANVSILPGVNIGGNTVIGAGSVVNKDIPSGVVAAGNPCKVIRPITEKDKEKYAIYKD